MFASHLIASTHQVFNSGSHQCCLCGAQAMQEKKEILKKTFTNWDVFQFPNSEYICDACAFCLSPLGRRHSFVCTEFLFVSMKREEISKYLFSPPRKPFVFCVTTTFKKYLWLHAKINANISEYHIRFDDCDVWCRPEEHQRVFQVIEILYQYFTKDEIRRGDYHLINIERLMEREEVSKRGRFDGGICGGICGEAVNPCEAANPCATALSREHLERHENLLKFYRGSGIFELSLHAANKKEGIEWKTKPMKSVVSQKKAEQLNLF